MKISRLWLYMAMVSSALILQNLGGENLASAATRSYEPRLNLKQERKSNKIKQLQQQLPIQQKSRAPEPASLILFLSGITAALFRFIRRSFDKFKRLLDIALSIAGLLLTAPLSAYAAILIKLSSPGPVIYKQNRLGKHGRVFRIYKLRTMFTNAENATGAVWAKENDSRVTPVGNILRKTHLDEIPQFINVLKGQMSIVGPRPERPELVRDLKMLVMDYEKRLQVKPGITGLAQVRHKYDETIEDVKKKIKFDLAYIRNMCFLTDLKILGRTCVVVLTGKSN